MPNTNQKQLLKYITEVSFALDDISLYLDTHPDCSKGLSAYAAYKDKRQKAVAEYVGSYGPLNRYQVNNDNYYDWVNKPWPWEKECDC